jgi:hypothetical protein
MNEYMLKNKNNRRCPIVRAAPPALCAMIPPSCSVFLGEDDGCGDHGRADCGDCAHTARAASNVCGLVSGETLSDQ